jgi:hypothetical protein
MNATEARILALLVQSATAQQLVDEAVAAIREAAKSGLFRARVRAPNQAVITRLEQLGYHVEAAPDQPHHPFWLVSWEHPKP